MNLYSANLLTDGCYYLRSGGLAHRGWICTTIHLFHIHIDGVMAIYDETAFMDGGTRVF